MDAVNDKRVDVPYSGESEAAVLGALLLDNQCWDSVCEHVAAEDFYFSSHRFMYQAIEQLAAENAPFDPFIVSDRLKTNGHGKECSLDFVSDTLERCPSAVNAVSYAKVVREKATLRGLIQVGGDLQEQAKNPDGAKPDEIRDEYEQKLFDLGNGEKEGAGTLVTEALQSMLEDLDHRFNNPNDTKGLSTGLDSLDKDLNGLENGDLIIVAAAVYG